MEKAKACKSNEELVALARDEGIELTREQLDAISGGESLWDIWTDCDGDACWGFNE